LAIAKAREGVYRLSLFYNRINRTLADTPISSTAMSRNATERDDRWETKPMAADLPRRRHSHGLRHDCLTADCGEGVLLHTDIVEDSMNLPASIHDETVFGKILRR
jgi:hypothetical protein